MKKLLLIIIIIYNVVIGLQLQIFDLFEVIFFDLVKIVHHIWRDHVSYLGILKGTTNWIYFSELNVRRSPFGYTLYYVTIIMSTKHSPQTVQQLCLWVPWKCLWTKHWIGRLTYIIWVHIYWKSLRYRSSNMFHTNDAVFSSK